MSRVVPVPIFGQNSSSTAHVIDGSLHFTRSPAVDLRRTNDVEGNRGAFTLSCWVKNSTEYDYTYLLGVSSACQIYISNDRKLTFDIYDVSETVWALNVKSERVFRDESAWHHIVLALDSGVGGGTDGRNSDRLRLYVNGESTPLSFGTYSGWGTLITGNIRDLNNEGQTHVINTRPGSNYQNSFNLCEFNYIDGLQLGPQYFGFTDPLTGTWRPKKFIAEGTTYNNGTVWSSGSTVTGGSIANADKGFDGLLSASGYCNLIATNTSTTANVTFAADLKNVRKLEVFAHSTSSSGDTRGTCQTAGGQTYTSNTLTSASQDFHTIYEGPEIDLINVGWGINQNGQTGTTSDGFRAFRVNGEFLIDSTTRNLDFGVNGVYLPMDNADDFEVDKSGKGNNYTKTNWAGTDSNPDVVKDSPSGPAFGGQPTSGITTTSSGPANYCTLNPIDTIVTLKDGNLETDNSSGWQSTRATIGMKSGKFYWETQNNQTAAAILGISNEDAPMTSGLIFGSDANPAWAWAGANYYFNSSTAGTSLSNHVASDIVQYALDVDAGKLWFGRNGTWYNSSWETTGDPANGVNPTVSGLDTSKTYFACASFFNGSAKFNFGQKPFEYAPPQGFLPINSANTTPVNVIPRPDQYVGVKTWSGTAATHSITGLNFNAKPDLVWLKESSSNSDHGWWNSVMGQSEYNSSNSTQGHWDTTTEFTSFDYNGFTLGNNTMTNQSGQSYVAWCWKAGGDKNTFNVDDVGYASASAAGLDGGTITPTGASVGTKQGFSIIKYNSGSTTGNYTLAHGMGKTPKFIIHKQLTTGNWWVYHADVIDDMRKYLQLNSTNDVQTNSGNMWGASAPTDSVFGIRVGDLIGTSTDAISYIWADVPGLQKFGQFAGNNSDDGVYVELGFKPAILLIKNDNSTGDWIIWDNARNPHNPVNRQIWPYTTSGTYGDYDQVASNYPLDFLSNGFKMRTTDADMNGSSRTYIYAAWAESSFSNLYGGQSLGR